MKNKVLALFLALCMVLAMLPMTANAAQAPQLGDAKRVNSTVGTLEPAAVEPNAKSYSVSLSGSSHGTVELLVDSPAQAGSEVYFLADPDDGYLAYIYCGGVDPEDVVYMGAGMYGFIMPAGKVTLEVEFVAAEGEAHSISVYDGGGSSGRYALERSSAKESESVLLAVRPNHSGDFDPLELVWAFGADVYYLFEEDGIFYFEIFMGGEDVKILLTYSTLFAFQINYQLFLSNGDVTTDVKNASAGEEVLVYATPDPGYLVDNVRVKTKEGGIYLDLNYVGEENGTTVYSFIMPPCGVTVEADFRADIKNVTVRHNSGGTASADVTQAKVGDTVTVTCQPEDNYRVYSVTGADGITDNGDNTYSFVMPARDVTIDVTFKTIYNPVKVTVETGLGGTASADLTEAKAGDTVTLTVSPEEGYRVARITGVKDLTDNGDGTYTFAMPDAAVELKVLFLRHENPFLDVNETHFFYDPVLWAATEGITSGMTADTFGPFAVCNRAQVVTFLWRYAGSPEPVSTGNPFVDVLEGSFYHKAVLWAVENGITKGVSTTEFGPNLPCNRAQVVTFLWRLMEQPEPELTENPFTDVDAGSFYEKPVLWALEKGITTGATATTFNPVGRCQRAQVVTFLHRTAQLPPPAPVVYALAAQFDAEQGTVTLSHTEAAAGEVITATVIPAEGYALVNVHCLNDTGITIVSDTEYTFVMPDHEETFVAVFAPIATEPNPTEPKEPVKTYELDLRTNGNGEVSYVDNKRTAAPGESVFFYAVPNPGYALTNVGIFNPNNEINVDSIQLYEHGNDLYELVMIDHDIIMTCHFTPIG